MLRLAKQRGRQIERMGDIAQRAAGAKGYVRTGKAAAASGDIKTKNNNLAAHRQQLSAQSGKALTRQQATLLTNLSKGL